MKKLLNTYRLSVKKVLMAGGDNLFSLGKSAEDFYGAITSRSGSHQTESGRLVLDDKYPFHLA